MQSKNEVIVRDLGVGCGVLVRQEGEQSGAGETLRGLSIRRKECLWWSTIQLDQRTRS